MTASTPEAVERLARHTEKACKCEFDGIDVSATLRALSAALDKLRMRTANQSRMLDAAEAERDALKAELAGAVEALQFCARGDATVIQKGNCARAFLASHQKEKDT